VLVPVDGVGFVVVSGFCDELHPAPTNVVTRSSAHRRRQIITGR
jgi:hypothetical protein